MIEQYDLFQGTKAFDKLMDENPKLRDILGDAVLSCREYIKERDVSGDTSKDDIPD